MNNHMNLPSPERHRNIRTMNIEQGNKGIEQNEENKLLYAYLYERLLKIMLIQVTWRLWTKEQRQKRDSNQLMHIYI